MPEPYSSKDDVGEVTAVGDSIPPGIPENISAKGSASQIEVDWDEPSTDGDGSTLNDLDYYVIYWDSLSGFDKDDADGSKKVDSTLFNQYVTPGDTRYYKVTAVDQTKNESQPSSEVSATSETSSIDDIQVYGWSSDLSFSADGSDTVEWTSGTIKTGDGQTFSIDAGNTGSMSSTTYIYFDSEASETELQTTTTAEDAVGGNQILICTASNTAGEEAKFQVFNGSGGLLLGADEIAARVITGNKLVTNLSFTSEAVIASGGYIESEDYNSGSDGFRINANGNAEFNDGEFRGTLYVDDISLSGRNWKQSEITIDGSLSITGDIQSDDYSSGSSGWLIDGNGSAEFNDVTVRGSLFVGSTDSIEIEDADGSKPFENDRFQGAGIIDQGFAGEQDSGTGSSSDSKLYTTVKSSWSFTVPDNKKWVIIANFVGDEQGYLNAVYMLEEDRPGFNSIDPVDWPKSFQFWQGGVFWDPDYDGDFDEYSYGGTLSSGSYSNLDVHIYHYWRRNADNSDNDTWASAKVFWQILEIPD